MDMKDSLSSFKTMPKLAANELNFAHALIWIKDTIKTRFFCKSHRQKLSLQFGGPLSPGPERLEKSMSFWLIDNNHGEHLADRLSNSLEFQSRFMNLRLSWVFEGGYAQCMRSSLLSGGWRKKSSCSSDFNLELLKSRAMLSLANEESIQVRTRLTIHRIACTAHATNLALASLRTRRRITQQFLDLSVPLSSVW
jgi:hypothetical protein